MKKVSKKVLQKRIADKSARRLTKILSNFELPELEKTTLAGILKGNTKLSPIAQLKRLDKIILQIKQDKFNLVNYLKRSADYQTNKVYLPDTPSNLDLLKTITRSEFYYQDSEVFTDKKTVSYYDRKQLNAELADLNNKELFTRFANENRPAYLQKEIKRRHNISKKLKMTKQSNESIALLKKG